VPEVSTGRHQRPSQDRDECANPARCAARQSRKFQWHPECPSPRGRCAAVRAFGIETKIGCHTFRATGITIYLTNGGDLEKAQQMAAHESPRTTKLYDRRNVVSLDEVEKVVF
jgi:integrase